MLRVFQKNIFLPSDLDELRERLKIFLPEKQAGINSNIIEEEIIATVKKTTRIQMHNEETT